MVDVSGQVTPPLKVAVAVTIAVPAVTAVAVVVVGEKGEAVSDAGLILTLLLSLVKSILEIVPLLTVVVAVRTRVPPIKTAAVAGVRLRVQEGVGTVITVVSVHLTTPLIIALAVIVVVPEATPVAVVLYGEEVSAAGFTVATPVLLEVKVTLETVPF